MKTNIRTHAGKLSIDLIRLMFSFDGKCNSEAPCLTTFIVVVVVKSLLLLSLLSLLLLF